LEVKNLSVIIDDHTLVDNISFTVDVGSITAIIGPNGAGKSILVKALLGLINKTKGSVKFFGTDHERYREVAPLISYIPQYLAFDRDFPLTVRGLFALKSPQPLGMAGPEITRMKELLAMVNLTPHLDDRLSTLSGGQLQRALIAYSLMDHPKLLILDEPSAGIDISGQETIYELLRRIQTEEHLTMVLVSHELDVVMQYADQVLCLNKELLCAGVPSEVLSPALLEKMYGTQLKHLSHGHHAKHS
jgi:ABC-type Mn2+/Zn2+ transport system ATPase subunit